MEECIILDFRQPENSVCTEIIKNNCITTLYTIYFLLLSLSWYYRRQKVLVFDTEN